MLTYEIILQQIRKYILNYCITYKDNKLDITYDSLSRKYWRTSVGLG